MLSSIPYFLLFNFSVYVRRIVQFKTHASSWTFSRSTSSSILSIVLIFLDLVTLNSRCSFWLTIKFGLKYITKYLIIVNEGADVPIRESDSVLLFLRLKSLKWKYHIKMSILFYICQRSTKRNKTIYISGQVDLYKNFLLPMVSVYSIQEV